VKNRELAVDHLRRASVRLLALDVLFEHESWADVVRESQEVVELALKGLLRAGGVEAPRIHDVSEILLQEAGRLPASIQSEIERLAEISRQLRRDRELAFYGSNDLTPSTFYRKQDAVTARDAARMTVELVRPVVFTENPTTD
jgi:HEPN domain-containing protein